MANKRMIAKSVITTDTFLEMRPAAQALYFQLQIEADEYGFVAAPKKIVRGCMRTEDELQELIDNGYCFIFPSGHLVMLHWLQANKYERKREPTFREEFLQLTVNDDLSYNPPGKAGHCPALPEISGTSVAQSVAQSVTQSVAASSSSTSTVTKINDCISSLGLKIPATEIQSYLDSGLEPIVIVWAANAACESNVVSKNAYFRETIKDKIQKGILEYEHLRDSECRAGIERKRFDKFYGAERHKYDGGKP